MQGNDNGAQQPKTIVIEQKINSDDTNETEKSNAITNNSNAETQESENESEENSEISGYDKAISESESEEGEEKKEKTNIEKPKNVARECLMRFCEDEKLVNAVIKKKAEIPHFFSNNLECWIILLFDLAEKWETNNETLVNLAKTQIKLIWKDYVLKKKVNVDEKIKESDYTWKDLANKNLIHFSEKNNNPLQTFEIDRMVLLYLSNNNQYKRDNLFVNALSAIWDITKQPLENHVEKLFCTLLKLSLGARFPDSANKLVQFTDVFKLRNGKGKLKHLFIEPIEVSPFKNGRPSNFIDQFEFLIGKPGHRKLGDWTYTTSNPGFDMLIKVRGRLDGEKKQVWIFFEIKAINVDEIILYVLNKKEGITFQETENITTCDQQQKKEKREEAKKKREEEQKKREEEKNRERDYNKGDSQRKEKNSKPSKKGRKNKKKPLETRGHNPVSEKNTNGGSQSEKIITLNKLKTFPMWKILDGNYSTVENPKTTVGKIENQQAKLICYIDDKLNELSKSGEIDLNDFMDKNLMVYVGISLRTYENSDKVFLLDHYHCFGVLKPFLDMVVCGNLNVEIARQKE